MCNGTKTLPHTRASVGASEGKAKIRKEPSRLKTRWVTITETVRAEALAIYQELCVLALQPEQQLWFKARMGCGDKLLKVAKEYHKSFGFPAPTLDGDSVGSSIGCLFPIAYSEELIHDAIQCPMGPLKIPGDLFTWIHGADQLLSSNNLVSVSLQKNITCFAGHKQLRDEQSVGLLFVHLRELLAAVGRSHLKVAIASDVEPTFAIDGIDFEAKDRTEHLLLLLLARDYPLIHVKEFCQSYNPGSSPSAQDCYNHLMRLKRRLPSLESSSDKKEKTRKLSGVTIEIVGEKDELSSSIQKLRKKVFGQ